MSFLVKGIFFVAGEHPAAMQHGGQLRIQYPISAAMLSIIVTVMGYYYKQDLRDIL